MSVGDATKRLLLSWTTFRGYYGYSPVPSPLIADGVEDNRLFLKRK